MEEIKSKARAFLEAITSETAFAVYIIATLVSVPYVEFFSELDEIQFYTQPILLQIAGYVGIFMTAADLVLHRGKDRKYYPTDVFFLLLIILAVLSMALTGEKAPLRHELNWIDYSEWLTHFFAYFSLMYAGTTVSDERLRKKILIAYVAAALIQTLTALPQAFGYCIMDVYFGTENKVSKTCYGLLQNTNWYGGLSSLFCACTSGIFLFSESKPVRGFAYVLTMICFFTLLSSNARLAVVGAVAFICFYLISILIVRKKNGGKQYRGRELARFGVLVLGIIAVTLIAVLCFGKMSGRFAKTLDELNGDFDGLGSHRGYIWRYAFESIPHHLFFGVGLDNFLYVYTSNPRFREGDWSNAKAHNEYIHYLATQGIFQLINYLSLLVYAVVVSVRNILAQKNRSERSVNWIFLGMFAAYSAQALFNSSVINVAIYFWAVMGLCAPKKNQRPLRLDALQTSIGKEKNK